MRRSHRPWVVALLATSVLLLGRDPGNAPDPPKAVQTASGIATVSALGASVDAADVVHVLRQANPVLSERELERIARAVMRCADEYELAPELVTAVLLVESGARPWVRSPKGAVGLMQVMPHMHRPLGMAGNLATIETNIEAGCLILARNIRRLGEDRGVLAYFWGSDIRDATYLRRVQAARAAVQRLLSS